jgi:hypothetical protein
VSSSMMSHSLCTHAVMLTVFNLVSTILMRICDGGNARGNGDKGQREHYSDQISVRDPATNYIVTLYHTYTCVFVSLRSGAKNVIRSL